MLSQGSIIYYAIYKNAIFEIVVATQVISFSYRRRNVSFHMKKTYHELSNQLPVELPFPFCIAQMQIPVYIFHIEANWCQED